jgi:hypothetical protein
MHFSFGLIRIKASTCFRALLAHTQEALHKRHLVYCVRVMSVGSSKVQPTDILQTKGSGVCDIWNVLQSRGFHLSSIIQNALSFARSVAGGTVISALAVFMVVDVLRNSGR